MSAGVKRIIVNTSAAPAAIGPYNQVRINFVCIFSCDAKPKERKSVFFFHFKGRKKLVYQDFSN